MPNETLSQYQWYHIMINTVKPCHLKLDRTENKIKFMRVMFICMNDTVSRSCKILYSHLDQVFSCTTPVCKALCKTHCEGLLDIVYTCFRYTPVRSCAQVLWDIIHTHTCFRCFYTPVCLVLCSDVVWYCIHTCLGIVIWCLMLCLGGVRYCTLRYTYLYLSTFSHCCV